MIRFACPQCRQSFQVPDALAGRRARCNRCGGEIRVPESTPAATSPLAPAPAPRPGAVSSRPPVRTRRLMADADAMQRRFDGAEAFRVLAAEGDPPGRYRVELRVTSLAPGPRNGPVPRGEHVLEIELPQDYPRLPPLCRMLTPVFHPNIDPAKICVGDHWTAGEQLVDLVVRIAEMLAYQAYNIRSPLDGEAAMWADLNGGRLPTDPRDFRAMVKP